jgi:hypothetical protein
LLLVERFTCGELAYALRQRWERRGAAAAVRSAIAALWHFTLLRAAGASAQTVLDALVQFLSDSAAAVFLVTSFSLGCTSLPTFVEVVRDFTDSAIQTHSAWQLLLVSTAITAVELVLAVILIRRLCLALHETHLLSIRALTSLVCLCYWGKVMTALQPMSGENTSDALQRALSVIICVLVVPAAVAFSAMVSISFIRNSVEHRILESRVRRKDWLRGCDQARAGVGYMPSWRAEARSLNYRLPVVSLNRP